MRTGKVEKQTVKGYRLSQLRRQLRWYLKVDTAHQMEGITLHCKEMVYFLVGKELVIVIPKEVMNVECRVNE